MKRFILLLGTVVIVMGAVFVFVYQSGNDVVIEKVESEEKESVVDIPEDDLEYGTSKRFQSDADLVRLKHLQYYVALIEEYYTKTGRYPYGGESNIDLYTYLGHTDQEVPDSLPIKYSYGLVPAKLFFATLEDVLERSVDEYYDPQFIQNNARPNHYVYMLKNDSSSYFFSVNTHNEYSFSTPLLPGYNKIEVSNTLYPQKPSIQTNESLSKDVSFQKELKKEMHPFFLDRQNKFLNYTDTLQY